MVEYRNGDSHASCINKFWWSLRVLDPIDSSGVQRHETFLRPGIKVEVGHWSAWRFSHAPCLIVE